MKHIRTFLNKYAPPKRYYFGLCFFCLIYTSIEKVGAVYLDINHYTYEYGMFNPWVKIHNNEAIGMQRLMYMLKNSNMGVEWIPQYILIDAALVYLSIAIINFIYEKTLKKY